MKGCFDKAKEILYEIIRQYPNYHEPFNLLGLISEERKEIKKAAHFLNIAAELSPTDSLLWEKVGFLYLESKCHEQAASCFSRALKSDQSNIKIVLARVECYIYLGDIRKAIKSLEKVLLNDPLNILVAKKFAKFYAQNN